MEYVKKTANKGEIVPAGELSGAKGVNAVLLHAQE